MRALSRLPPLFSLVLLVLLSLLFSQLFTAALIKLKLDLSSPLLRVSDILPGSPINTPVKRVSRTEAIPIDTLAVFELQG